jgi:hypothetical protein
MKWKNEHIWTLSNVSQEISASVHKYVTEAHFKDLNCLFVKINIFHTFHFTSVLLLLCSSYATFTLNTFIQMKK